MSDSTSGRHRVVVPHLVMGVAFLGLLAVWALVAGDVVNGTDIRFLLPVPWVLAGGAGLVALVVGDRRKHVTRQTGWVGTPPDTRPDTGPDARPDSTSDTVEP